MNANLNSRYPRSSAALKVLLLRVNHELSIPPWETNRTLFERAVMLDGKRYPFDSVPMTKHDWQKHYQPLWGRFVSAKRHFDPDGILTPGQGIF